MKKAFIITGGNRGLGESFVDILGESENHLVISLSRSRSEEQKQNGKSNFYFLKADLSEDGLLQKLNVLKELIGSEDIYFINNASIIEPITKIAKLEEQDIDRMFSVNIKSTMLITKYLLSNFLTNKLTFINISSGAANRAISNWSLYCSSKAFIQMFYKVAETEYEQHRFFTIDPGVMDTDMQKSIRENEFPDVLNFKNLREEGKLRSPIDVARQIITTVL